MQQPRHHHPQWRRRPGARPDPRRGPAILVALAIALGAAAAVAASDEPAQASDSARPRAPEFGGRAAPIDRDAVIRAAPMSRGFGRCGRLRC